MANLECSACRQRNVDSAKFCVNCGARLGVVCSSCAAPIEPGQKFCGACGAPAGPKPARDLTAERRIAAVFFCDLEGSTALSQKLDSEDLLLLIRAYQDICATAISRYEGNLLRFVGDGVLAVFGFPVAHEEDSHRAILAGLAVIDGVKASNKDFLRQYGTELSVRISIHTGSVIAGEMGSAERPVVDLVGDTPNIAARLQEFATSNSLVVSSETYRLTEKEFIFESKGLKRLKGIHQAVEVFKVSGFAAASTALAKQVVGRKEELAQLRRLWKRTQKGQGHLALIRGDPGIGKSALVNALVDQASKDPATFTAVLNCSPFHQSTPFFPVIEYFRTSQMHLHREDSADRHLAKLEEFALSRSYEPAVLVPILAPLLSIPYEHRYPEPPISAEGRRIRTLETIVDMVMRQSGHGGMVLLIENIHWADPSTIELLQMVLARLPSIRALVMVTFRPYYRPTLDRPAGSVEISLDRLEHLAVWELARQAAAGKDLPFEVLDHIATKTDGVPLFVEELTKTIIESGAVRLAGDRYELVGAFSDLAVPATLQGSLLARIERASERKDIAQVAAVVGREFSIDIISAVAQSDPESTSRAISSLVSADLVYQVEAFAGTKTYRFRHALIQNAAYDSLLRSTRQKLHGKIATYLEGPSSEASTEQPEIIANHHSLAGAIDDALKWWSLAGQRALGRSANAEAIAHFTHGLEVLERKVESPEKIQIELAMLTQRGTALIATRGFAAPEVGETFRRAETICEIIGETPLLFPVIWGLWVYHLVGSKLPQAADYAEQMIRLANISGESGMFIEGHFTLGNALFWQGRLREAKENLDRAITYYDPVAQRGHAVMYGQDPGVTTLCYQSFVTWSLGFPDRAVEFADQALETAQRTGHPFSVGWALAFVANLGIWRREYGPAKIRAQRCVSFTSEQGQAYWASAAVAMLGAASYHTGDREVGLEQLARGLAGYEQTGAIVMSPLWRGVLAEALIEDGKLAEAAAVLEEGLTGAESHGEWVTVPYLQRLRGDVHARQGRIDAAQEDYRASFERAASQGALMRQLQAARAWARLSPSEENLSRLRNTLV